jgi:hypothetical protein
VDKLAPSAKATSTAFKREWVLNKAMRKDKRIC